MRLSITISIICVLFITKECLAFRPLFDARIDYPIGNLANSVHCADLNNDGYADIAVAPYASDSISILINDGEGSFRKPNKYFAGDSIMSASNSIVSSDFDNDGDTDLAVISHNYNKVSVLFNDGNGEFVIDSSYDTGRSPSSIFARDLNNDNYQDLIVTNHGGNQISIMFNGGNGIFGGEITDIACTYPYSSFSADLNNDGDNDLAVIFSAGMYNTDSLAILLNDGNSAFHNSEIYGIGPWSHDLYGSDIDNDGDIDLAIANSNMLSIIFNNGDATFAAPVTYQSGSELRSVFIGDLAGNGYKDVATISYFSSLYLYSNQGDGTLIGPEIYNPAHQSCSVFLSDLGNDGLNDIIVASYVGKCVSIWRNKGGFLFPAPVYYYLPRNPRSMKSANLDGNNYMDMIVQTDRDTIFTMRGRGDRSFVISDRLIGNGSETIIASDFNADGIDDIMQIHTIIPHHDSCSISIALNNGNGIFGEESLFPVHQSGLVKVFANDYDGDGYCDIAAGGFDSLSILLNDQNGSFRPARQYNIIGHYVKAVTTFDFDNDGNRDLTVGSHDTLTIFRNTGNASYEIEGFYSIPITFFDVFALDFDSDGHNDLALFGNNWFYLLRNSGNGNFEYAGLSNYTGFNDIYLQPIGADIDSDGLLDILTAPSGSDNLLTIINSGNGTLEPALGYGTGGRVLDFAVGDIDGDGNEDLAAIIQDSTGSKIQFLINQTGMTDISPDYQKKPHVHLLSPNYPNPFNAKTTIQYTLARQSVVSIEIYDILGRRVEKLAEGMKSAGSYQAIWDASDQSSGIYFYRIKAGDKIETKKMVLIK